VKLLIRYSRIVFLLVLVLLFCGVLGVCADVDLATAELSAVQSYIPEHNTLPAIEPGQSFTVIGDDSAANNAYAPDAKPDLTIESITWTPENPSKNDSITISAVVRNQGDKMSLPTGVHFYADGNLKEEKLLENIQPGETITKDFTWIAEQGAHLISITVDNENIISESDEDNNELSVTITPLTPDLVVDSITWLPETPLEGDNVTFFFTVKNQGEGAADYSLGTPYIDNDRISSISFSAIGPGAVNTANLTWCVQAGSYTVKLVIDPSNKVLESNESNNEKTVSFTPIVPDLFVKSVTWSPLSPSVGETVTFSVTIGNQGLALGYNSRFNIYIGDSHSTFKTAQTVSPDSSKTETLEWVARPGQYNVKVVIDPYNNIVESDESNNELMATDILNSRSADLTIDSVSWSPLEPLPGETVTFSVIVRNGGYGDATYTQLDFYVDDANIAFSRIGELPSGNATNEMFTWIAEEGAHTIRVVADSENEVFESDEDNNEKIAGYPVPPDLVIKDITLSPLQPSAGDNVTFTVTIMNEGDSVSEYASIACYIDNVYLAHVTGNSIQPDATDNLTFTYSPEPGIYILKVLVDPFDKLVEADENNNEMTTPFSVSGMSSQLSSSDSNISDIEENDIPGTARSGIVNTEYNGGLDNIWFFALLAGGIIILLSYLFFEYRRRRF
jgi:subtilase family serine protease